MNLPAVPFIPLTPSLTDIWRRRLRCVLLYFTFVWSVLFRWSWLTGWAGWSAKPLSARWSCAAGRTAARWSGRTADPSRTRWSGATRRTRGSGLSAQSVRAVGSRDAARTNDDGGVLRKNTAWSLHSPHTWSNADMHKQAVTRVLS